MPTKQKNIDPESAAFGAKLKVYRERMRLTQGELAALLSDVFPDRKAFPDRRVIQSRVAKWEGGEARPYGWQFVAVAAVTRTPLRYWLLSEINDLDDPAATADAGMDLLDEDARFLLALVKKYGARAIVERFTGLPSPTPTPKPAPEAAKDEADETPRAPGTGPQPNRGKRYKRRS